MTKSRGGVNGVRDYYMDVLSVLFVNYKFSRRTHRVVGQIYHEFNVWPALKLMHLNPVVEPVHYFG